jgi:hypothetical protein
MDDLTADFVREVFDYDPHTGAIKWRVKYSRKVNAGMPAGYLDSGRYVRIRIKGRAYAAHRIAFLYMHGRWPTEFLDHVNGDKTDNRLVNLRECSSAQNNSNRPYTRPTRAGVKGVRLTPNGSYEARISANGRRIYLGKYDDAESAKAAYQSAALKYHGEFAHLA